MSYIEITKSQHGTTMPNNAIRMRTKSLSISGNIANKFQRGRNSKTYGDVTYESFKLGLAVDADKKRIKLVPDSANGFAFRAWNNSDTAVASIPVGLRRSGLPTGDYRLIDESTLEFELAE